MQAAVHCCLCGWGGTYIAQWRLEVDDPEDLVGFVAVRCSGLVFRRLLHGRVYTVEA